MQKTRRSLGAEFLTSLKNPLNWIERVTIGVLLFVAGRASKEVEEVIP